MDDGHKGLVAITGANGTIGYNAVLHALRTGYRVRCIVRREQAITTIKAAPSLRPYEQQTEFLLVPDNTATNAYDQALTGVDYVIHIAGVWPMPNYHPDKEIYLPFVKSMENILSAAEKAGTVRRIVFTQAGAALANPNDGDTLGTRMDLVLDEHVPVNAASANFRPPLRSPHHAYCGAKAFCMKYLHDLQSKSLPFSIVQVIPGTVIGKSELVSSAADAYAQMDRMSKALLFNEPKPRYAFGFVHVEDCARVHVEALDEKKAPPKDLPPWFVAAATTESGKTAEEIWKEVGDMVEREFKTEVEAGLFTVGRDNLPVNMPYAVNSTLTEKTLLDGRKFRSLKECVEEVARWYSGLVKKQGD